MPLPRICRSRDLSHRSTSLCFTFLTLTKARRVLRCVALAAALLAAASAYGAQYTWTGAFFTNEWDQQFNWNPVDVPPAGSDVVFGNPNNFSIVWLNGDRSVNTVTFNSFTPFTLLSDTLSLSTGVTSTNTTASPHTIGSHMNLLAATDWNIDEFAPVTVSGSISGIGGINKITGLGMLTLSGNNTFGGAVTVSAGTLSVTAGTTPSTSTQIGASGTLQLEGGVFTSNGNIDVAAAGTLNLLTTGVINGNGTDGFAVDHGSAGAGSPGRSITTAGTLAISGSSSQVDLKGGNGGSGGSGFGGVGGAGGTLSIVGGTTSLSGSVAVNLRGGSGGGAGAGFPGAGGSGGNVQLSNGLLNMTGGQILLTGGAGGTGLFDFGAPGAAGRVDITGGSFNFTAGQITANTGVTPATPASLVQATMNISAGAMNLLNNFTNSAGTINLTGTGVINGNGANGVDATANGVIGPSISTSGTLNMSGSSAQINLSGGNGGNGFFSNGAAGGSLSVAGGATSLSGASILRLNGGNGGNATASGDVARGGAGGTLSVSAGTLTLANSSMLDMVGGNGGSAPSNSNGPAGGAGGTVNITAGAMSMLDTSILNLKGGNGGNGNQLGGAGGAGGQVNLSGGTFNMAGGQILLTGGSGGAFNSSGPTGTGGSISVTGGTFAMSGGEVTTGSFTRSGPGAFNFTGGTLHVQTFNGDLVNSGGTLAPGTSAGTTTVNGAYTQNSGSLDIELGGVDANQFDELIVTGNTTLGGNLNVSLIDSFIPTLGQSWEIIDVGGTLSGAFTGLPQAAQVGNFGGVNLFVNYAGGDGNDVTLVAARAADFDLDFDVDGDDFLLWQTGFPTASGATKMDGDADGDGDVDGDDFLIWQTEFRSPGEGSASAAVPEPASIVMLLAMAVVGTLLRRRGISRVLR